MADQLLSLHEEMRNDGSRVPDNCLGCICSLLIPPLGVYWCLGLGWEVLVCLVLTLCGYFPGLLFAIVMIWFMEPSDNDKDDNESGNQAQ
eukprot:CAMPEP_0204590114 /NCGR_PEP_ID=MMETSP0661-20131031/49606_1 /ASSEMBLY_ACC=CAM_ASM_000606 /TAXON_ID=109239 /ORGANISM="Alexandrium margalefi, Strain AMGDE01CS-322" /LENGTH=89 /DNA_ID=CAMNT_0051600121 /DNA_START=41 /DNA_END=310 /DNA_ORIENTATION=+